MKLETIIKDENALSRWESKLKIASCRRAGKAPCSWLDAASQTPKSRPGHHLSLSLHVCKMEINSSLLSSQERWGIHKTRLRMCFFFSKCMEVKIKGKFRNSPAKILDIWADFSRCSRPRPRSGSFTGHCGKSKQFTVWSREECKTSNPCWLSRVQFQILHKKKL